MVIWSVCESSPSLSVIFPYQFIVDVNRIMKKLFFLQMKEQTFGCVVKLTLLFLILVVVKDVVKKSKVFFVNRISFEYCRRRFGISFFNVFWFGPGRYNHPFASPPHKHSFAILCKITLKQNIIS